MLDLDATVGGARGPALTSGRRCWCMRPRPGAGSGCSRRMACLDLLELFAFVAPGADGGRPRRGGWRCALDIDVAPDAGAETAAVSVLPDHRPRPARAAGGGAAAADANRDAARRWPHGWGRPAGPGRGLRYGRAGRGRCGSVRCPPSGSMALRVWKRLPRMGGAGPRRRRPPRIRCRPSEARARLAAILGPGPRSSGRDRPTTPPPPAAAFAPREAARRPASGAGRGGDGHRQDAGLHRARPACGPSATAATVWISTFTRHLQRQIEGELARLFPDPVERRPARGDPQGARELPLPAEPTRMR